MLALTTKLTIKMSSTFEIWVIRNFVRKKQRISVLLFHYSVKLYENNLTIHFTMTTESPVIEVIFIVCI